MRLLKLLYICDSHWRGTTPSGRSDNLPVVLLAKLREVIEIAKEHEVTAILHGGDFFDRPDVAPAVAREFLTELRKAPCPIYGIAGNHDVYGYNPDTIPRTMLGVANGVGVVRLIKPGEVVALADSWKIHGDQTVVQVTGQEFHAEIDRRDPKLDYCVGGDSLHQRHLLADFHIHLTHGMLLEEPFFENITYTLLDTVGPHTQADVTFGAHYHPGWSKVHDYNGKLWIHPGGLTRLKNHRSELERTVQVVLLTLQKDKPVRCELIPLKSAPHADDIFDPSKRTEIDAREAAKMQFVESIGDTSRFEVLEVQAILSGIAASDGVRETVKAEALRRIAVATEATGSGEDGA